MCTTRLPVDQRHQGLAERPGAAFVGLETSMVAASSMVEGDVDLDLSREDWEKMTRQVEIASRFGAVIERVAVRYGQLPSIIAGFCSRRSGWGLDLEPEGVEGIRDPSGYPHPPDQNGRTPSVQRRCALPPPDGLGCMRGLMGLEFDRHHLARGVDWRDPERNMDIAFGLIADYRIALRRRTTLQGKGLLRASLNAFECGIGPVERAVRQGMDVDSPSADTVSPIAGSRTPSVRSRTPSVRSRTPWVRPRTPSVRPRTWRRRSGVVAAMFSPVPPSSR